MPVKISKTPSQEVKQQLRSEMVQKGGQRTKRGADATLGKLITWKNSTIPVLSLRTNK